MKEITFEEAREVIKEWGINSDNYSSAHTRHFMNGGEPTDNSIEAYIYHQRCLKIVAEAGLETNGIIKSKIGNKNENQ